jgi:hypothetical protein
MGRAESRITIELSHHDYSGLEWAQDRCHVYPAGQVFARAGRREAHALVSANTLA